MSEQTKENQEKKHINEFNSTLTAEEKKLKRYTSLSDERTGEFCLSVFNILSNKYEGKNIPSQDILTLAAYTLYETDNKEIFLNITLDDSSNKDTHEISLVLQDKDYGKRRDPVQVNEHKNIFNDLKNNIDNIHSSKIKTNEKINEENKQEYRVDFDNQKIALGKMAKSIYEQLPEQSSMINKNKHRKYIYNRDKEAIMLSALFLPLIKNIINKNGKSTDLVNQGVYLRSALGKRYINDHRYHINITKKTTKKHKAKPQTEI